MYLEYFIYILSIFRSVIITTLLCTTELLVSPLLYSSPIVLEARRRVYTNYSE
ncbi:hypothetical protein BDQ94DRAFT_151834 [Aspergillus welwitschiae]|uniref:Uncharacterized protein n=1 Tax=Aspergillus welwitschiae TaxID=1341132 RepID=A0A3F3PQF0_9EURO|nr:hypothetical protein BDQ94DRAFT_151834 [Aspergillus welwitschiae]RDH28556.1 hypothetical protein BDQ94DRAFT_151834 [Aspergillus welwitschiae]